MRRLLSTVVPRALHADPVSVSLGAVRVAVEEGRVYRWCACGRTLTEPWCDGKAHLATTIRPVVWKAPKSGLVGLCGCRHSRRRPLCDGAHAALAAPASALAPEPAPSSEPPHYAGPLRAWSYGEGYLGTLGALGSETFQDAPAPRPVPALVGFDVAVADCGWGHSAFLARDGGTFAVCGRPLDFRNTLRNISIRRGFPAVQAAMNGLARLLFPADFSPQVVTAAAAIYGDGEVGARASGDGACSDGGRDALVHLVCGKGGLTGLLTRSGRALLFGGNKFGQCGTGVPPQLSGSDVIAPPSAETPAALAPVAGLEAGERCVGLALGQEHALCVTDRGALYSWGRGDRGQLGHGTTGHLLRAVRVMGPDLAWAEGGRVVAVQAGASQSAAIDVAGSLWLWGKMLSTATKEARADGFVMCDQLEPRRVAFADEAGMCEGDADVVGGGEGAGAGEVGGQGAGGGGAGRGSEGGGDKGSEGPQPDAIAAALSARDVGAVDCTGGRLLPLSRADTLRPEHAVAMRGGEDGGDSGARPRRRRVVAVTCGQAHTCFLTDDGRLWMVGLRGRGVLFDDTAPASGAAAGGAAATEASAEAAAEAASGGGDAALPEVLAQTEPLAVRWPTPLAGLRIVALRSGLHNSLALTDRGRVFRWGWRGRVRELVGELAAVSAGARHGAAAGASVGAGVRDISLGFCHTLLLAP